MKFEIFTFDANVKLHVSKPIDSSVKQPEYQPLRSHLQPDDNEHFSYSIKIISLNKLLDECLLLLNVFKIILYLKKQFYFY
ncbi:MAG: hypothetical protein COA57_10635 [Flavobacteriales bacterium]|nr:MAG: hypothetical protein COA57_10635 [Flavobacteriales bacterium]